MRKVDRSLVAHTARVVVVLAAFGAPAWAVDGVIEINQARVVQPALRLSRVRLGSVLARGGTFADAAIAGVRDVTVTTEGDWNVFALRVEAGTDVREEVFRLATERHWTLRELSQRRATLEDVFVEITHPDEA